MKILVNFPSRSRPDKFIEASEAMVNSCTGEFKIVPVIDEDDPSLDTYRGLGFTKLIPRGKSNSKIHACNRGSEYWPNDWDILVNMSDDMMCVKHGWDSEITKDMQDNFPDTDGFLHYNDGNQKSNVCTLSIMGRKYYDRFGYIYHPSYKSLWSDCEATEVAHMLGKYKYMGDDKILFRHMHPSFGHAQYDAQYRASEAPELWDHDKQVIVARRVKNYDLRSEEIVNGFKYLTL